MILPMKKGALVLLALLLAGPVRVRAADDPHTLTYALSTDIDSLDPDWAYDATSQFAIQQMYEGLVDFDGPSIDRFTPRMASVIPSRANGFLSADGMTYAFPLRGGVKFHDGSTMTPADVKYSLLRFMLLDRDGGPSSLLLEPMTGRRTVVGADGRPDPEVFELADKSVSIEGGAIVLRLQKPFAPLLSVLAGFAPVVSKSFVAAHGGWDGRQETWMAAWNVSKEKAALYEGEDGTGPFKLVRWDRALKRLTLARHDAYWRSPAQLAGAVLVTVEEAKTRRRMLESGEADVAQVDPHSLPYFQAVPGAVVDTGLPLIETNSVIFFNFKIEPKDNPWLASGRLDGAGITPEFFADPDVRKGFAFAFDTDAYIREGFQGAAVRARGPIPKGLGYTLPASRATANQIGLPYSLDESSRLLRAVHGGDIWANGFLLPMAYPEGNSDRRLACRLMAEGLAKVNPKFRVDCRGIAQTKLLEELLAHRLSAFVYRWALDYPDPHNAVEPFLHSTGFFGSALSYSNPRADAMVAQAAAESDPNERRKQYSELEALALYDIPAIFTVDTTGALARRVKVQNWNYNPMQSYGMLYEVTKLP
ncbi:MAG: ABC transporter substrate-binding protein [Elusimicrobiota bacterium]